MNDIAVIPSTSNIPAVASGETASNAVAAQAKALVEARYTVALHRPRDLDLVRERLLKECKRPSFAAVARYRKPIGKGIEGPSIRFAEAAIRCMSNVTVECMTVFDDREKRIVRVSVTDLEANVPYSQDITIEKTIERKSFKQGDVVIRSRTNSYNETVHLLEAGEDDLLNKQGALTSKAIRTLGLRLVPGDLVDEAMSLVKQTMRNQDAADPDAAKRKLFDAFADIGIRAEQLKEYLGGEAGTLTPKQLSELRGLYAAIRDGETNWREVMDSRGADTKKATDSSGKGSVSKLKAAVAPKTDEAIVVAVAIRDQMTAAESMDDLNDAFDLVRDLPNEEHAALVAHYEQRRDALERDQQ